MCMSVVGWVGVRVYISMGTRDWGSERRRKENDAVCVVGQGDAGVAALPWLVDTFTWLTRQCPFGSDGMSEGAFHMISYACCFSHSLTHAYSVSQ